MVSAARLEVSGTVLSKPRTQYGALPFRIEDGVVQVLLATSRETRRWVIPKGWPMKGKSPHRSAAREAFEEAGVKGSVETRALGSYSYEKRLKDGATVTCRVEVFPLRVEQQRRRWPEHAQRETKWFDPAEAAAAVQEPELATLIGQIGEFVAARA
jgi:8-oxo-dGTP pyrophosphatase MutT (NUDIX family)